MNGITNKVLKYKSQNYKLDIKQKMNYLLIDYMIDRKVEQIV